MNQIIPLTPVERLIDRTRTVLDWTCPRARYYGFELNGRGISKASTSLALFMGITIHDALAAVATFHLNHSGQVPIDDIADAAREQMIGNLTDDGKKTDPDSIDFAHEQAALVEGLVRGYHRHVWPRLLAEYPNIICVEQEMEYELAPGYIFMTKPDLVMENRSGDLFYLEYKSTSSKKPEWISSWDTAVQLHSSIKATEKTLGRPVAGVQIVGLYKGYESYGKQSSPFCYAYKKSGNPPFTTDQIQYEYKAGFKRIPTWELPGGTKAWVESMPEMVLANQFPMTAPIFVDEDLVNSFWRQRALREDTIATGMKLINDPNSSPQLKQEVMDIVFPQHFDKCQPAFGWACDFKKLCHSHVEDPLTAGFEPRTPHHSREVFDEPS